MENDKYLKIFLDMSDKKHDLLAAVTALVKAASENDVLDDDTAAVIAGALRVLGCGDDDECENAARTVRRKKDILAPDCAVCMNPCTRTSEYTMEEFFSEDKELQAMKAKMLLDILENGGTAAENKDIAKKLFMFGYEKDAVQLAEFLKDNMIY